MSSLFISIFRICLSEKKIFKQTAHDAASHLDVSYLPSPFFLDAMHKWIKLQLHFSFFILFRFQRTDINI